MLAAAGYEVTCAADGAAALALAEAGGEFDLLLADAMIGGPLSGRELAAKLRRTRPGLAVVLMSGDAEAAGEGVLPKPFGPEEVLSALHAARNPQPAQPAPHAVGA